MLSPSRQVRWDPPPSRVCLAGRQPTESLSEIVLQSDVPQGKHCSRRARAASAPRERGGLGGALHPPGPRKFWHFELPKRPVYLKFCARFGACVDNNAPIQSPYFCWQKVNARPRSSKPGRQSGQSMANHPGCPVLVWSLRHGERWRGHLARLCAGVTCPGTWAAAANVGERRQRQLQQR